MCLSISIFSLFYLTSAMLLYTAMEAVVQEEEVEDVVAVVVVDLALAIIVRNVVQVSETRTPMNHQQQSNT